MGSETLFRTYFQRTACILSQLSLLLKLEFQDLFTYIFAIATVPTDATQAAVDHLDGAQYKLQQTYGQQNGEQNDVPHHCVFRVVTDCPQSLV